MNRWHAMRARKHLPSATLLVAFPLILYAPLLFGRQVLYWGVYLLQFYPWRQLAVEQIRAGHWPLWNPYLGAGAPLAANLQTAAFYPPNVLFLLMPVERAFGWELALHVALAGLSAYALGRTLGLSRFGALLSGLAYGGGGYVVARWVFPSMVYAAAWLPLMLTLVERLVRRGAAAGQAQVVEIRDQRAYHLLDAALLALIVALQLLAGHAQTSFYSLLIVAAFGLTRIAHYAARCARPGRARALFAARRIGYLALSTLWALALAAIQILPTAELAAHSHRAGNLTDMTFALGLSFWPWRLISLLAPDFFGNPARGEYWAYNTYWEEAAYVGVLPLMLALAALVAWWRTRRRPSQDPVALVPFLSILSFVSLILALGDHTPLYPLLFRYLPGFGLFQAPARLMIGYALGVALLAGIGADALRPTPRTRTTLRIALVAGMALAVAGAVARLALPAVRSSFGDSVIRLGVTLALAAGVLLLRGRPLPGKRWEWLVVALVVADLLLFGWGLAPGADPALYHTNVATAEFLKDQPPGRLFVAEPYAQDIYDRYVSLSQFGSNDPATLQGLRESLLPNLNSVHHLAGMGNYDPLTVAEYRDLVDLLKREGGTPPDIADARPILNLFGARYVIGEENLALPLLYKAGPRIYANETALPEALIVHQARVIDEAEAQLNTLLDPDFDPRSEVVLSDSPLKHLAEGKKTGSEQATVLRQGPNQVIIEVKTTRPGYLVLADTYYPGWRATVDGAPTRIFPANHAFRSVEIDAGEHTIVFEYAPLSFRLGAWITTGALSLLVAVLLFGMLGRRSQPVQHREANPPIRRSR